MKMKNALKFALRIVCIPFMLIGIAVWGTLTFAKIGIEVLGKRRGTFAK